MQTPKAARNEYPTMKTKHTRKLISSHSEFEANIGYSRAVVDDNTVFISGTTGFDYQTQTIATDIVDQAHQCFKNIETALTEANSSFGNVVRIRYIFTNRKDFEPCWPVFKHYLDKSRPAATMFIAELLDTRMKLEVEVTAKVIPAD
jgi:enamine deaminase RidA (YjgF/YER057c/UK114 family)